MNCPCGTSKTYEKCCEPFIKGKELPETAEKLMRSRFTAFAKNEFEYVKKTLAPEARKGFDIQELKQSAKDVKWKELQILKTKKGGPDDETGVVEFTATYDLKGEGIEHHEVSDFRRDESGQWLFVDGDAHTHKEGEGHHHHEPVETVVRESPKVGRNDPCHCGSGKKFKKCHGG